MKKLTQNKFFLLLLPFLMSLFTHGASAQGDSIVSKELVKLKYFNDNNSVQFLILENSLKTGKKVEPVTNKVFQIYLDSNKAENLIAKLTTDNKGKAKTFLPPALKAVWEANPSHKFIAVAEGKEEAAVELEITKGKIKIDTISENGTRSVVVQVMKNQNGEWVPANEVEMKVGIQRHGGILSAGDEEVYTTDSSGTATVELKKDSLPGDQQGNIVLAAKVEDNELFGNLLVEKTVSWGVAVKKDGNFFDKRSLWSTRIRTPLWLLLMAYSIVIGVWGTIFYLVFQIVKIKRIGTSVSPSQ
ncbi:MAG: hypothetical protein ABI675_20160 [Chitinophagaceae bacterium]